MKCMRKVLWRGLFLALTTYWIPIWESLWRYQSMTMLTLWSTSLYPRKKIMNFGKSAIKHLLLSILVFKKRKRERLKRKRMKKIRKVEKLWRRRVKVGMKLLLVMMTRTESFINQVLMIARSLCSIVWTWLSNLPIKLMILNLT